ncbi:LOW QUALITY PROTEIN: cytochrome P450 3A19-like [Varroa destructor]|uniref:Cytochrome P450 n=1 Tax=Varroa destructor TaxID=109461 RepID=A0A7M7K937_VARDE|nr:LOW QUALITY PROTEIN: cytochrome P450 3A19-like [Varroa destructor]
MRALDRIDSDPQAKWHQEHGPVLGYFIGNISAFAVADAQMVRQIEIKDFIDFTDRPRWKRVRSKLTPSFTSNELKTVTSSNDGKIPVCMRNQYPYLATCYCMKRLIEVSSILRYETTSSSLAFITKELLRFPDVQGRFRDELIQLTTNGQVFDFECLQRCQCMVAVIQETLRMNPPTCGELTYQTYPNLSLGLSTSVHTLRHTEDYFREAHTFRPWRLFPENRPSLVTNAWQPFGARPCNCIRTRFAHMEIEVTLAKFLTRYRLIADPMDDRSNDVKHCPQRIKKPINCLVFRFLPALKLS